jgi:hypothetical protein
MTSIALFRLGFNKDGANPKTVYVSLGYESPEISWPPVLARLQEYVDEYNLDLHVYLEHGVISHCAFKIIPTNLKGADLDDRVRR